MARRISHRKWRIDRDDYRDERGRVDEGAFRAAVQNELAMTEYIGERLGVAIVAAPIRTREFGGDWFTVGWAFETASVPAATSPASEVDALEDALADVPEDVDLAEVPE